MPQDKAARPGRDGAGGQPPGAASKGAKKQNRGPTRPNSPKSEQPSGKPHPVGRIEVAGAGDTIVFRVVGLGSVRGAGTLWEFAERSISEGRCCFAVDLSECRGLGSTFLGTLVRLSQEVRERSDSKGWVAVFNCSEANRELFEIVGADRYVRFRSITEMEPIETEPLTGGAQPLEERLELVRRAHENLIGIDRRNEARFGEFLRRLAAELAGEA